MKKVILIICLLLAGTSYSQIFRFSTVYASFSTSTPFSENQSFMVNGTAGSGQLVESTIVNKPNYILTLGIRKIARFDYQVKRGRFYIGDENEISDYATISNAPGLEYLLQYSKVRDRGMEFNQEEYKIRYISNYYTAKASYVNDGLIDLKYTLSELRLRKSFGDIDFTFGVTHRSHPVYGYSPVDEWFAIPENKHWWQLANQFGYTSDNNEYWFYDGECIAQSDIEFYRYHFGDAVNRYNHIELNKRGLQQEISPVIGLDYYYNSNKFWVHSFSSVYPIHKGLSEYSYNYIDSKVEWDLGLILGMKFNNHFSIFVEGRYLKFWDITSYQLKTGINYLIF